MRTLELLAPARNADIGIAAIDCGADAVYIAGPRFGARQNAGNSMDDVQRLCAYARRFGARVFLTLNTILFEGELEAAGELLKEARDAGVDAVIVQDLAVFEILRSAQGDRGDDPEGPARTMHAHASTQCAIRTPEQARFYESLGATRLVLERQLSLEQVKAIRDAVSCELEFFVHGALCMCYSGQCYMSEAIGGRSANRGECVQACRSVYDLVDGQGKTLVKDKALLSLKDLNLCGRLEDLAGAGVDSFKIEGRLKNISYVRNVVRAYSQALDELVRKYPAAYRRASFGSVVGGFSPDLRKTFNRGYTQLFLDGKRGRWSSMDAPKSVGERIGTVAGRSLSKVEGRSLRILLRLDSPKTELHNGDGFCFVSRDHNGIVGFRGDVCQKVGREEWTITTKEVQDLYPGAVLHRNLDIAFEKETEANPPARRIHVGVSIEIPHPQGPLAITAESEDGRKVEMAFQPKGETAQNQERMKALFSSQIGKATGDYSFSLERLVCQEGLLPLLSASALNGIRRELASILDAIPCGKIPMHEVSPAKDSEALAPKELDYKFNVSNDLAQRAWSRRGAEKIDKAFELAHQEGAELMRSKYCIRHELGLCIKDSPAGNPASGLFLVNNGKRYRLEFDCAQCEMTVNFD